MLFYRTDLRLLDGGQVASVKVSARIIYSAEGYVMFGLFKKDPLKTLQQEYYALRLKARDLQRNGDIKGFAAISAEVEKLSQRIDILEQSRDSND